LDCANANELTTIRIVVNAKFFIGFLKNKSANNEKLSD
jgi:hypothetical protein